MALTSTVGYRETVAGVDYTHAGKLTIPDLPAGPYVDFTRALQSVSLAAQMTTDLPDTVRDQDGLSVVSGDIVLGGSVDPNGDETKTAAWLFNPDSLDSPLRHLKVNGCKVIYEDGVYVTGSATPETHPLGQLFINGYDLDHQAGTVTLHVTELDEAWLTTPDIPAVVTTAPYNAGLTSEFPMDQVIRSVYGASTWPARRAQCLLAAGFRASITPEVGAIYSLAGPQLEPLFAAGAFGSAFSAASATLGGRISAVYTTSAPLGTSVFIEYWVTGAAFPISVGIHSDASLAAGVPLLTCQVDLSGLSVTPSPTLGGPTFSWATSTGGGVHYIAFLLTLPAAGGTSWSVTAYKDGSSSSSGALTFAAARNTDSWHIISAKPQSGTIEALQVTAETAPTPNNAFVPQVVLDPSLNPLTVVPAIPKGTKAWETLQTIASTELGYIRKDANGIIRFTNRQTILGGPVCRDITSTTALKQLGTSVPPAGSYRTITVPYTEWNFGARTAVWTLGSKKLIRPNRTVTWQQAIPEGTLIAAIDTTVSLLPDNHANDDGGSWYRASLDPDGVNAHPGLTITATILSPGLLQISVTNKTGSNAYLVSPSTYTDSGYPGRLGQPSLWIGGIPATPGDEATVTCTYADGTGELAVASNEYLQDHDTAVTIGNWLLNQLYMDIRDFTNVSIVPDGTIEIGDIDRLVDDPSVSNVSEYVLIWGWSFSAEFPPAGTPGGSRDMSLNVRALGPPDAPLGGAIPDRFEVGTFWAYG